jgi:hypothetical protein
MASQYVASIIRQALRPDWDDPDRRAEQFTEYDEWMARVIIIESP